MSDRQSGSLAWIQEELNLLQQQNLHRSLSIRESPHVAGKVQIGGNQYVDFGSNDYLSLSAHPRLVDIVKSNVGYVGWGSGSSPLIHGRGTLHARLEQSIADFEATEACLTFTSGFAANVGAITSLVGKNDVIYSDAKNHASIIDGCRLSGADVFVYRHGDVDHLRELISQNSDVAKKLIVTDGLFSMDGDLAPLDRLVPLAKEHDAMLLVDEAHATGVLGPTGKGVSEHFGVKSDVDVIIGTLSKAIGCHGGFVAGTKVLIDWMVNKARSYIFSTAVPEATCMAAVTAIELVSDMNTERQQLLDLSQKLREQLNNAGFNTGHSASQIVPVILGDEKSALDAHTQLKENGLFVPVIRPPSVPKNESMLRISLNTGHTEEMIVELVRQLTGLQKA